MRSEARGPVNARPDCAYSEDMGPVRTCVICRKRAPKASLRRFTINDGEIIEDFKKSLPGRGFYLCASGPCEEKFLDSSFKKGFMRRSAARKNRAERAGASKKCKL